MRKLRYREDKLFSQGSKCVKWQSQDSNFNNMTFLPEFSATESQRREELELREVTWRKMYLRDIQKIILSGVGFRVRDISEVTSRFVKRVIHGERRYWRG